MTTLTQAAQSARDAVRSEDARLNILLQDLREMQEQLDQAEETRQAAEKRIDDLREHAAQKRNEIGAQEVVCQQARGLAEAVGNLGIEVPETPPPTEGRISIEEEARQHYRDDPTLTAPYPAIPTGDGGELVVTEPDNSADKSQRFDRRAPRRTR